HSHRRGGHRVADRRCPGRGRRHILYRSAVPLRGGHQATIMTVADLTRSAEQLKLRNRALSCTGAYAARSTANREPGAFDSAGGGGAETTGINRPHREYGRSRG